MEQRVSIGSRVLRGFFFKAAAILGLTIAAVLSVSQLFADEPPKPTPQADVDLPTATFFSATEHARSFAYVIDRSGSMAMRGSFEIVKRELGKGVDKLPADVRFSVNFYNLKPVMLNDAEGHPGLMAATETNKAIVRKQVVAIEPDGGTDHMDALRLSLTEKPEVVFFLTDGDLMMTKYEVILLFAVAGKTRIHVAQLGRGPAKAEESPLQFLAKLTGGTYRYFDITKFPRQPPKVVEEARK